MSNVGWWAVSNFMSFVISVAWAASGNSRWFGVLASFNAGCLAISAFLLKTKGRCM